MGLDLPLSVVNREFVVTEEATALAPGGREGSHEGSEGGEEGEVEMNLWMSSHGVRARGRHNPVK